MCPTRVTGKKRTRVVCQLCGEAGHEAGDCPYSEAEDPNDGRDGGGEGAAGEDDVEADEEADDEEEDEATSETPSEAGSCLLCHAKRNEDCVDEACLNRERRCDRLERRKRAAEAKAAKLRRLSSGSKSKAAAGTDETAVKGQSVAGLTTDEILKLSAEKVAHLNLKQIILLPETYYAWVNGPKKSADCRERHRQLFETLNQVLALDGSKALASNQHITAADVERARRELTHLKDALDPSVPMGKRIASLAKEKGYELVAFREAQTHGWSAVRRALEVHRQEAQVSRPWAQALAKGVQAAKASSPGRGSGKGGGGGRGGRAGGRGGRGSSGGRGPGHS